MVKKTTNHNMTTTIDLFKKYIAEETRILSELPHEDMKLAFDRIMRHIFLGKRIFIIGNGGSGSNSSHLAMELGKNMSSVRRVQVFSLNDNIAWISAITNDDSFDSVYSRSLKNLADKGDLLIALSTSGNTVNIVDAAKWAIRSDMIVIGITGCRKNILRQIADISIVVPSEDSGHIENVQQMFCHMMVDTFKEQYEQKRND